MAIPRGASSESVCEMLARGASSEFCSESSNISVLLARSVEDRQNSARRRRTSQWSRCVRTQARRAPSEFCPELSTLLVVVAGRWRMEGSKFDAAPAWSVLAIRSLDGAPGQSVRRIRSPRGGGPGWKVLEIAFGRPGRECNTYRSATGPLIKSLWIMPP